MSSACRRGPASPRRSTVEKCRGSAGTASKTCPNDRGVGGEVKRQPEAHDMALDAGQAVIRPWRPDDAAPLAEQANERRIWLNLRDAFPHPYGVADADRFIAMALGMSPRTYFAVEVSGSVAGGIGYTLHGDVERVGAEVGYWLGVAHWGKGI